MPVDANIPLQAQAPQAPDFMKTVANAYALKDMILKDKQQEQQMATQSALKDIYADPTTDLSTPEGQSKAVKRIMAVDPAAGIDLQTKFLTQQKNSVDIQKSLAQMSSAQFDVAKKKIDSINQAYATIQAAAQGPNGNNKAFMDHVVQQTKADMIQQGIVTKEQAASIPDTYDAGFVNAKAMQDKNWAEHADREQKRRDELVHQSVEEKQGWARVGAEEQRVGIERARLSGENKQIVQGTGADGKPAFYEVDKSTGKATQVQGAGGSSLAPTTKGGAAGGGSLNQRYATRVLGAVTEATSSLDTVSKMNNPSGGLFGGSGKPGVKNAVSQLLTTDEQKKYNSTMAGSAVEIATAMNQGQKPNEAQIEEVKEATYIGPTDNLNVQRYKVALGARYLRQAAEVSATNATGDQKQMYQDKIKALSKYPDPDTLNTGSERGDMFGNQSSQGNQGTQTTPSGKIDLNQFYGQ